MRGLDSQLTDMMPVLIYPTTVVLVLWMLQTSGCVVMVESNRLSVPRPFLCVCHLVGIAVSW